MVLIPTSSRPMDMSGAKPASGLSAFLASLIPYSEPYAVPGNPSMPAAPAAALPPDMSTDPGAMSFPSAVTANPATASITHGADIAKAASADGAPDVTMGSLPGMDDDESDDSSSGSGAAVDTSGLHPALASTAASLSAATSTPSALDKVIQSLMEPAEPSDKDRYMSLAQLGFGMAGSRSPYFLGAIGEGGQAGLAAFQNAQREATVNKARAAGLAMTEAQRQEQARHNVATETNAAERTSQMSADRQARTKEMQIYHDALLNRGKWQVAGFDDQQHPILVNTNTGDQKTLGVQITHPGKGGGNDVFSKKLSALRAAGYDQKTATQIASGIKPVDRATAERVAIAAAKARAGTEVNPTKAAQLYNQAHDEIMGSFGYGAAPGAAAGAAPAPAAPAPAAPTARPQGVPAGAKYSPSQKSWWWQDASGWHHS